MFDSQDGYTSMGKQQFLSLILLSSCNATVYGEESVRNCCRGEWGGEFSGTMIEMAKC